MLNLREAPFLAVGDGAGVAFPMRYDEFKTSIQRHLRGHRKGPTGVELREALSLPYDRPCPEWTRRLEEEIGLVRRRGTGRALVWGLG